MNQAFEAKLQAALDGLKAAGTYKHLRHLTTPMAPEVHMEEAGDVIVLSSEQLPGAVGPRRKSSRPAKRGLDKYGAGTASVRFICGTFDIHRTLEEKHRGRFSARGLALVRLVLEREHRAVPDGLRRRRRDHLRRVQPRLDHRRLRLASRARKRAATSTPTWPISRRNCAAAGRRRFDRDRRRLLDGGRLAKLPGDRRAAPSATTRSRSSTTATAPASWVRPGAGRSSTSG